MKKCPTCKQTYADDILYCIYDASELVSPPPPTSYAQKPEPLPTMPVPIPTVRNSKHLYLVIGGMAIVIAGLALSLIVLYKRNEFPGPGSASPASANISLEKSPTPKPLESPVPSKTVAPERNDYSAAGSWKGKWSTASGTMLDIEFTLNELGGTGIEGQIKWTMRRTVRPDKMGKIGMSAIEYIRGNFDPATDTLTASGYRKDDPNDLLVMLDEYRLTVSDNGRRLTGAARNGGRWNGRVNLIRDP